MLSQIGLLATICISIMCFYHHLNELQSKQVYTEISQSTNQQQLLDNLINPFPINTRHRNKQRSDSLEKISRLPPPGGTVLNNDTLEVLIWMNNIFNKIRTQAVMDYFSFNIIMDDDYNFVVGSNQSRFKYALSRHLDTMFWGDYVVHEPGVKRGSVQLFFNISRNKSHVERHLPTVFHTPLQHFSSNSTNSKVSESNIQSSNSDERNAAHVHKDVRFHTIIKRNTRVSVRFKVEAKNFQMDKGRDEEFKQHILKQIAKSIRVPITSIQDYEMDTDMNISFVLALTNDANNVMDENSIREAANDLNSKLNSKRLLLTGLDGEILMPGEQRTIDLKGNNDGIFPKAIFGVLIAILIMVSLLVTLTAILVKRRKMANDYSLTRSQAKAKAYQETGIQETGRDSILSMSGRYSYDSGVWLGPGPEPSFIAPEALYYRPPTREQLVSTPRPNTAVRSRLKNSWNIDSDQTLTPIPDVWEDTNIATEHRSASEPTYERK